MPEVGPEPPCDGAGAVLQHQPRIEGVGTALAAQAVLRKQRSQSESVGDAVELRVAAIETEAESPVEPVLGAEAQRGAPRHQRIGTGARDERHAELHHRPRQRHAQIADVVVHDAQAKGGALARRQVQAKVAGQALIAEARVLAGAVAIVADVAQRETTHGRGGAVADQALAERLPPVAGTGMSAAETQRLGSFAQRAQDPGVRGDAVPPVGVEDRGRAGLDRSRDRERRGPVMRFEARDQRCLRQGLRGGDDGEQCNPADQRGEGDEKRGGRGMVRCLSG
jgi:hypothetical protein